MYVFVFVGFCFCFFDLAKCFDIISCYTIKLEKYGVKDTALKLFNFYLEERSQIVRVGCVTSEELPITTGVPQEFVLGPLLFLVYMKDFPRCLRHPTGNLFAEDKITYAQGDTTLIYKG